MATDRRLERLIAIVEKLPPVVFAGDDKEREMIAKGVVLTIARSLSEAGPEARGDA